MGNKKKFRKIKHELKEINAYFEYLFKRICSIEQIVADQLELNPQGYNFTVDPKLHYGEIKSESGLKGSEDLSTFRQRMKTKVEIKDEGQE